MVMASRLTGLLARHQPISCRGTALPPPVLLMAKLLSLYLVFRKPVHFVPFVPFIQPLWALRAVPGLESLLQAALALAVLGLWLNLRVRACCLVIGGLLLFSLLADRAAYSNHVFFFSCAFLLAGLSPRRGPPRALQLQIALVYLAAGINKLCEPDWRSGQFFAFWAEEILAAPVYLQLRSALPAGWLDLLLAWSTIAIELLLGPALLWSRSRAAAILLGIGFHASILVFTQGILSWVFLYALPVSYLVFARWPEAPPRRKPEMPGAEGPWWAGIEPLIRYRPGCYLLAAALYIAAVP